MATFTEQPEPKTVQDFLDHIEIRLIVLLEKTNYNLVSGGFA